MDEVGEEALVDDGGDGWFSNWVADYLDGGGVGGGSDQAQWSTYDSLHTIAFAALALCFVAPPTEVVSAGLTVQNLFRRRLASEQLQFVRHHMQRTALTLMLHSLIPLAYLAYMSVVCPHLRLLTGLPSAGLFWQLWAAVSLAAPAIAGLLFWRWTRAGYRGHPIAIQLAKAGRNPNWAAVASAIDTEFRRYDKFVVGQMGRQVIVTDSWVLHTSAYTLRAAPQSDLMLRVVATSEHMVSHESGALGAQILRIAVVPLDAGLFEAFELHVNSAVYADLREKLSAPITAAQSVMIRQSLSDQFVDAFEACIVENGSYRGSPQQSEQCLGCMSRPADCRIASGCDTGGSTCGGGCRCRPMWCRGCLARWFASRQVQAGKPAETWLSGTAPCPTCRAQFCMLDVFTVPPV